MEITIMNKLERKNNSTTKKLNLFCIESFDNKNLIKKKRSTARNNAPKSMSLIDGKSDGM
ncbi:MAG: hypothetical protein LUO89_04690 [Methanothrix sp.]|nr:hypothetical protein [Methanothrix sp.]